MSPDSGKDRGQKKRASEDEMAEWHHDGMNMDLDKLQKMVRDEECCSPWGRKESDTNGQPNDSNNIEGYYSLYVNS